MDELFTFGCLKHRASLVGTPNFQIHRIGATVTTYKIDLDQMICPGDEAENPTEGCRCKASWKVGRA